MVTISITLALLELWASLTCFICYVNVKLTRQIDSSCGTILSHLMLLNSLVLLCDGVSWVIDGHEGLLTAILIRLCVILVYLFEYLMLLLLIHYLTSLVEEHGVKPRKIAFNIVTILVYVGMISVWLNLHFGFLYYFDANNNYHRASLYGSTLALYVIMLLISEVFLFKYRKVIPKLESTSVFFLMIMVMLGVIVQWQFFLSTPVNVAYLFLTLAILVLFIAYGATRTEQLKKQAMELDEQELQLMETRTSLMFSQIKPHFISNTLILIQGMYHQNIEKADSIMNNFIRYLQMNFSNAADFEPIPISKEITHTQYYTSIEKERWPDITFKFHIRDTDFSVPPLTVQPLVENAVRHGILPLESGGIITISTFETRDGHYVRVEDNGVGFDPYAAVKSSDDSRKHIGTSNIRDRLKLMFDGTLTIEGAPGKGSVATVFIPKERTVEP